jgi:predicted nucleic acid-binding protein
MKHPAILILDASVLINFLKISRIDLLKKHPSEIIITEHVRDEVTNFFPEQLDLLNAAIADGTIMELVISDIQEISEIIKFRLERTQNRCGMGECSAAIAAKNRGYSLGIDDNPAIKTIKECFPTLRIVRTQDLIVEMIQANILDVAGADKIKTEWEEKHRFKLKLSSFSELL